MSDIFAPPSKEELDTLDSIDLFAPPSDDELKTLSPSSLDIALQTTKDLGRGAAQGGSAGFGDELKAAYKALSGKDAGITSLNPLSAAADIGLNLGSKAKEILTTDKTMSDFLSDLSNTYKTTRDQERMLDLEASQRSPVAYTVGDIGAGVAQGVATGGLGLAGSGLTAGKLLSKEALKKGTLGALTKVGMAEGALQGLGRSSADLTEGDISGAAIDTGIGMGIGLAAPIAVKGVTGAVKGTLGLADAGLSNIPIVEDVYGHLKDLSKEGQKRVGQSFKQAGQETLQDLKNLGINLKNKALQQTEQFDTDILKAKDLAKKGLYSSTKDFKNTLQKGLTLVGNEIERQDIAIGQALQDSPSTLVMINDKLRAGDFNFNDVAKEVSNLIKNKKITANSDKLLGIIDDMRSGDYFKVSDNMRQLNDLIESADPFERRFLGKIKSDIQRRIDSTLGDLPGEAGNLYKKRMDLNKDYSLLASLRDDIGGATDDSAADLATKIQTSVNQKAGSLSNEAAELEEILRKAYQSGDQDLIAATEQALAAGKMSNKYNLENVQLGKMFDDLGSKTGPSLSPEAQNERLLTRFTQSLGKPEEFNTPAAFGKTINEFGDLQKGTGSSEKADNFLAWLSDTYGDNAKPLIEEIQDKAKKFRLFDSAREINDQTGQDTSSWIRWLKKGADPVAFSVGKNITKIGEKMPAVSQANTIRALTQPIHYKNAVEQFKNSQKQGDATSNDVE
jgi:hypothetical protein